MENSKKSNARKEKRYGSGILVLVLLAALVFMAAGIIGFSGNVSES